MGTHEWLVLACIINSAGIVALSAMVAYMARTIRRLAETGAL